MNKRLSSLFSAFRCLGALLGLLLLFCAPLRAQNIEDLPIDDPSVPTMPTPVPPTQAQHPHSENEPIASDVIASPTAFLWQALYAGVVVAGLCSYLGLFVVARRMVFIGVALAEISSAGIAMGLLVGFAPLWGGLAFMLLGVILFSRRWAPRRL
ncbi:hypothetical protein EON80_20350, partial [bacterium]